MPGRYPPLKSLEVFVTAGSLLSFGKAADELGLSPSAVSRRIRALEQDLDVALFIRRSKSVELTPVGERYLKEITPAFSLIRLATSDLLRTRKRLVITTTQSFASSWLIPRLPDFRQQHPEINVDLEVTADITGRNVDNFDIGIFLSRGHWPGRHAENLMPITVFPVASPDVATQLKTLGDLLEFPLIHVRQLPNAWDEWSTAVGLSIPSDPEKRSKDMHYNDVQLAFEAAQQGLGIAVGADVVVNELLRIGKLVAPFTSPVQSAFGYYLVCAKSRLRSPEIRDFRSWIKRIDRKA